MVGRGVVRASYFTLISSCSGVGGSGLLCFGLRGLLSMSGGSGSFCVGGSGFSMVCFASNAANSGGTIVLSRGGVVSG